MQKNILEAMYQQLKNTFITVQQETLSMTVFLGLGLVLFSSQSVAVLELPLSQPPVVLQGGGITITEISRFSDRDEFDLEGEPGLFSDGQYIVQNNSSDLDLFAFAVSNNETVNVYTQGSISANGVLIQGWDSTIVNSSSWASTSILDGSFSAISLAVFGNFTDFFDVNDSVNLYSRDVGIGIISPGDSVRDAFYFGPDILDSTGVVFGSTPNGNTSISVSNVPLPAAFWLFGSSVIGLITINSRKK